MKRTRTLSVTAAASTLIAVATTLVLGTGTASAAAPSWETGSSGGESGTITLYDSAGNAVHSGQVGDKPIAAYAVASSTLRNGDTHAVLEAAQPNPSANIDSWNQDYLNSGSTYPLSSGPANIQSLSADHPVVTGSSSDFSLKAVFNEFPNSDTSGNGCAYQTTGPADCTNTSYQNLYQLRIQTSNGSALTSTYAVLDVQITNATYSSGALTGGTWTQVFPTFTASATPTTTALGAVPDSPQVQGTSIKFTATVSPSSAAGMVTFKDIETPASPVTLGSTAVSGGTAELDTTLSPGTHSIAAYFTPTDSTAYQASDSSATPMSYTINYATPTALPTIYPAPHVGATSGCVISYDYGTLTYTWHYGSTQLATTQSYTVPEAYFNKAITCTATSTNGDQVTSSTSKPATVGIGRPLAPTVRPVLYNNNAGHVVRHGTYEYVRPSTWSPPATSYLYQWYVGTTAIRGATSYRFLIPASYVGHAISCLVTARRAAWTNGSFHTAAVKVAS